MAIFFGDPSKDALIEDNISSMQEQSKDRIKPTNFAVNPLEAFTKEEPPHQSPLAHDSHGIRQR